MIRSLGHEYEVEMMYKVKVRVITHDSDDAAETATEYVENLLDDEEVKILDCEVDDPKRGDEVLLIIREDE